MRTVQLMTTAAILAATAGTSTITARQVAVPPADPVKIVALGDSLTSGHRLPRDEAYPARLEEALKEEGVNAVVVNHGVSGDTSSGGVRRLSAALEDRPDILIVALGVNDGLRRSSRAHRPAASRSSSVRWRRCRSMAGSTRSTSTTST
jgi:acyl-CoA thioesterase-1